MKNILIFNDTLKYGGTETLLVDILNHLSQKDCSVTLLLPFPTENNTLLKEVSPKIDVKYIYPERPSRLKRIIYENLMAFTPRFHNRLIGLNLNKYDLLVSFKDSVYTILFSRSKKYKILWIHNLPTIDKYEVKSLKEYIPVKLLKKRIYRLISSFRKFDEVVCVSNATKERYIDIFNNGKTPQQHIQVLYNAIDEKRTLELSQKGNSHIVNHPSFVMITRFSAEKRVDRVITAADRLKKEGYKFHIYIVGDGVLRNKIENQISTLGLNKEIELLGYMGNPYPFLKLNNWLVSSSERESFSLVILESIFLGVPVITTDCGGPTEITENGKYGVLTENSTDGVYKGIKTVLDNPDIAKTYTSQAEECLKRFNYNEWLLSVEKILKL